MSSPPKYPLRNAELPLSCILRDEDQLAFNVESNLNKFMVQTSFTNNKKRRTADEQHQNHALNCDLKRRLTIKDENLLVSDGLLDKDLLQRDDGQDDDGRNKENEDFMMVKAEDDDNNIANQILTSSRDKEMNQMVPPSVLQQMNISSYDSTELPLPSPSASPKQTAFDDSQDDSEQLSTKSENLIAALKDFTEGTLSKNGINNLIFKLIQQADRSTLCDFANSMNDVLKRDFLTNLPTEISYQILDHLDYKSLNNALLVSKSWNKLITSDFWLKLLIKNDFITSDEIRSSIAKAEQDPHYYQKLCIHRYRLHRNWVDPNFEPRKITAPGHGANVVTCLQFDDEKIITGADDKNINIYDPNTGELLKVLEGHEGGVWALKYVGNQIVSGSTDRTVRVWNLKTGKCTHVFKGHTSTIRCMEIVTNEATEEKFIITGSRDNTLHVWRLPDEDDNGESFDGESLVNPYFVTVLRGHSASVRAVAGHGNTIISGSYDHTVRVWDLKERRTRLVLEGHTDRIYATILDIERNRCISASMDATIRVWDLTTGECLQELTKHTSLVGLLGLTSKHVVSAAADGTVRGWDPDNYDSEFILHQDNHAAITTFHASPNILAVGSEGQFNIYDLKNDGKLIRSNILGESGPIWSAKFNYSKCIVAVEKNSQSYIEILDFSKSA